MKNFTYHSTAKATERDSKGASTLTPPRSLLLESLANDLTAKKAGSQTTLRKSGE